MATHTVYLSLGSNLGDRAAQIERALARLTEEGVRITRRSSFYETEPVEFHEQDWFLNLAAEAETQLTPQQLLQAILRIEKELGRERIVRAGPRTVDIDIVIYGDNIVVNDKELEIPHPRMAGRRFVLIPMVEIAPALRHPMTGRTMAEMLAAAADESQVRPWKK